MRGLRGVSVLLVTLLLGGCSAVCVQMGFGLGLGASVAAPAIVHTGFHLGGARYFGWGYNRGFHGPSRRVSTTTLLIYHSRDEQFEDDSVKDKHMCFAMLCPFLWDIVERNSLVESTGLEVTVSGLLFSLRFGFNPGYWATDWDEEERPEGGERPAGPQPEEESSGDAPPVDAPQVDAR